MTQESITAGAPATTRHGIVLLLASIMPAMAIISLVPVLPLLMQEFGAIKGSEFLVPMAMTIPALCVAVFAPAAGWLTDRLGRKHLLFASLIIYSGIGVLPWFLTDLTDIIAARIGLGLAEAVIMTIATTLIGDYFQGTARERWVGLQFATVSLSAIILIAIGGLLGELLGSRGPFLLYLLAIPVALLVAWILFEPDRSAGHATERGAGLPMSRILPLLLITLFLGIIFYTVIVKLGEILGLSAEVSPGEIGAIGAAANIGVAIGTVLFRRIRGASGPTLVLTGMLLAAAGYLGAGVSDTLAVTSVSIVIACLGFGVLLPTMLTWTLQLLPESVRGTGAGMWNSVFFFGQFFAPILAAFLQGKLGGLANVLLLFAGLCFAGSALAAIKRRGAPNLLTT